MDTSYQKVCDLFVKIEKIFDNNILENTKSLFIYATFATRDKKL